MKSSKSNSIWWPRYVGDYQRKTAHLSLAEHGAYVLLLDHYYSTAKPLPANADILHRVCRAFAPEERAAVQSVISQFFSLEDDGYQHTGDILQKKMKNKPWMYCDDYLPQPQNRCSTTEWRQLRRSILRSRPNVCVRCGNSDNLQIDHIKPVSKGGTDSLSNLQILCRPCNLQKGANNG